MRLESKKHLFDIQRAAANVGRFLTGRTWDDYQADDLLRSAVERQFEIIGEAMGRLAKTDLATVERITEYRRIVRFRNQLIHGYDAIDHAIVWRVAETKLPVLLAEVGAMLQEPDDTDPDATTAAVSR